MKNKILIITLLTVLNSFAQSSNSKADKLFNRMWYKEAATLYELKLNKLEKKENKSIEDREAYVELLKKAGDSYFFNTDMKNANKWYEKLVSDYYSSVENEYLFRYAHSLEGIDKYKEAKLWMKEFSKRSENKDDRSEKFDQVGETLEDILNIEPQFILKNISVNTKNSDFGPMYYKDKLIYSSAVDSSFFHTRKYQWNEQPFLNMYVSDLNEIESDVHKIGEFSKNLNTRYHEATLAFSPDYKRVYFTRNNYDGDLGRDEEGTNHLKLYSADLVKEKKDTSYVWDNVKELPFNSENYSVGHPTLSKDGKLLYFVSDMPGSIGATDIFVVDILQNENSSNYKEKYKGYSKPRNLGKTINTAGREMFPYITNRSIYFASDGHLGLGGLDVFKSSITENEGFSKVYNLGAPLNSELDDFSFIIKEDLNKGFVSSNRLTGKGDDDIYSFVRLPLEGSIDKPITQKNCLQAVKGSVANTITGEKIPNVSVTLFAEGDNKIGSSTTDIYGNYIFKHVLDCNTKYRVEASKTGYASKEKPVLTESKSGETIVPLGLETLNELIVEENGLLKIKIGIIYFDLDKSFIRNDAAIELNKIVVLMRQYPKMVIKIESHTDSRNTDEYNRSLSDRRAKSTKAYLIDQGIEAKRLDSAIGFGESQLINKCKNGVFCSEAEHQLNRRSEFIILKM